MLRHFSLFFLMMIVIQPLFATADCNCVKKRVQQERFNLKKIPPYWFTEETLSCLDLDKATSELDVLDQDLLIMKAIRYSRKRFESSLTTGATVKRFDELLNKQQIDMLFRFIDTIFPDNKRSTKQ